MRGGRGLERDANFKLVIKDPGDRSSRRLSHHPPILLHDKMKFLAFLPLLASLAAAQVSNDDPRGKEIYIISPACDSYKCQVSWKQGSTQTITWLNAPKGGLKIQLVPENGQSGSSCE